MFNKKSPTSACRGSTNITALGGGTDFFLISGADGLTRPADGFDGFTLTP